MQYIGVQQTEQKYEKELSVTGYIQWKYHKITLLDCE